VSLKISFDERRAVLLGVDLAMLTNLLTLVCYAAWDCIASRTMMLMFHDTIRA